MFELQGKEMTDSKPEDLQAVVEMFLDTVKTAGEAARAPKTGMQVMYHGDFCLGSVGPSALGRLEWWARRMLAAINKEVW